MGLCDLIKECILNIQHTSKVAGCLSIAKTMSLVFCNFAWPSITEYVNRYVDGWNTCKHFKSVTHRLFGPLDPLQISCGQCTDIIHDSIAHLPVSNWLDSTLTFIGKLTKTSHSVPCKETMKDKQIADFISQNM